MMKVELYDEVVLKDGRKGTVTEKWDETHFSVDVGMEKWENEDVCSDDIIEIIKKSEDRQVKP